MGLRLAPGDAEGRTDDYFRGATFYVAIVTVVIPV